MLKGVLAVSGKSGLFKMVSQIKNGLIVESLNDQKRMPVYSSSKVSALEDIAIYTLDEEVPLKDVFSIIAEKEAFNACSIDKKSSAAQVKEYFLEILPEYDEDRVYVSDMKKVFQWYNTLVDAGVITEESVKAAAEEEKAEQ